MRQQENLLRLIFDSGPALIAYLDSEARYRRVNWAHERWFGKPRAWFVGRLVHEAVARGSS